MFRKAVTILVACFAITTGIVWYGVYLPLSAKIEDPGSKVLPFVLQFVGLVSYSGNKLGIGTRIGIARTTFAWLDWIDHGQGEWKKGINITDLTIAGVPVTIFRPDVTTTSTPPGLIHFHGGGFAFGSRKYKSYMITCIMLANGTKSVVIAVDYRLAPENTFPVPFKDAFDVVSAVMTEPTKFGVDGNKIAVIGDSSGGLLSAAISLEFAKLVRPRKIAAQVLIYPWLQTIDMVCLPSYKAYREGFALSDKSMAFYASVATVGSQDMVPEYLAGNVSRYFMQTPYWKYLAEISNCEIPTEKSKFNLPSNFVEKVTDPRLSPLLAADLSGSPPTFVAIAEYDVLASEGTLFAKRIKEAGVPVVEKRYKTYHGFVQNVGLPIGNDTFAKMAVNDIVNFLNSVYYNNV
jgi:acetyl esterase/lipase